jgi:tRNA/rRNA methyltransferase
MSGLASPAMPHHGPVMAERRAALEVSKDTIGPAIILVNPQLGENIGMVARAMANFALSELRLVAPRDGWPNEDAHGPAAGATDIVDRAKLFDRTAEALSDLNFVCATTARSRDSVKQVLSPQNATHDIRARLQAGQRCGIMFGPEKAGLENDDIALADALVMAPVNPKFASLNLAHAVLIVAYEWNKGGHARGLGRETEFDGPAREGVQMLRTRPAERAELVGFFEHLERELDASGFLRPPEKRPQMVRNIRNLFIRTGASEQEVRTLRGIVSSLTGAHLRKRKVP